MATPDEQRIAQELLRVLRQNGQVQISGQTTQVRLGSGEVVNLGPGQPVELRSQLVRSRRRQARDDQGFRVLPIRGIFSEFNNDGFTGRLYIGMDRPEPELINQVDSSIEAVYRTAMKSVGPGINDWVVSLAIGPPNSNPNRIRFIRPGRPPLEIEKEAGWIAFVFGTWGTFHRRTRVDLPGVADEIVDIENYLANGTLAAQAHASISSRATPATTTLNDIRWLDPMTPETMTATANAFTRGSAQVWNPVWTPGSSVTLIKGTLESIDPVLSGLGRSFNPQSIVEEVGYPRIITQNQAEQAYTFIENVLYFPLLNPPGDAPGRIKQIEFTAETFLPNGSVELSTVASEYYDVNTNRFFLRFLSQTYWPPEINA